MSYLTYGVPSSGPGSGTVTSITFNGGLTSTPDPVTTTGTATLDQTNLTVLDGTVYWDTVTKLLHTTATGTAGQVLTSNGAGLAPSYQAAVGGVASVSGGNNITITGTATNPIVNVSGLLNHDVVLGNSTGSLTSLANGTTGQVLVATTGGDPSWQTFNAVTSITGNTGAAQTGAINLVTSNAIPIFSGAAGTITLNFALTDNLLLGSSGSITIGNTNVGYGKLAAASISSGSSNAFIGYESGVAYTTGSNSTAVGAFSMFGAIAGASNNTAIGYSSLYNLAGAGTNNTCLGLNSGTALTTTESNNILIGSTGVIADNNVTRIGTNGTHNSCYITGIDGVNVGSVAKVLTMASDKLGTATITAGTNISVTPTANTITIAATGAGAFVWSVITANQTAAVNNGYFCNKGSTLTLALPATSAVGDVIEVANINTALGVQFTQAANQQIFFSTTNTTLGATGTLTSSAIGDTLKLVCRTANLVWWATSSIGNWTPV